MGRLMQVRRSIARQKCLHQLLDPASFEPALLHLDVVLEWIKGTRHSLARRSA